MPDVDEGFAIVRSVVDQAELVPVLEAIADACSPRRAGTRHLLRFPAVRRLAEDRRLVQLAEQFIGGSAAPFKATLFDKSNDANWLVAWHQDPALPVKSKVAAPGWGPWSVKAGVMYAHAPAPVLAQVVALRIHFDDSTLENGPLRVLPRTHALGRLSDVEISKLAGEIAAFDCVVEAGGVIAMRPLTIHASSKSRSTAPRRVLHIEYAVPASLGAGIELAVA